MIDYSIPTKVFWFLLLLLSFNVCQLMQPGFSMAVQEKLTITIIPHRSNLGNEQAYSSFFNELEKETGIVFDWLGSKTYDDVIFHIQSGTADIGYVGPFAYVDAQDSFGVKLICRTLSKKKMEFYHSIIVTRKDSAVRSLHDLKGKSFSFTDLKSTSGYLFPMAQLKKTGVFLSDFSEAKFLKRHANSLYAVYKGHVDAGATSYTAVDKIDINMDEIRILWKSEPIYRGPWIARKGLPEGQFKKIQQAMLKISESEKSEEVFEGLTTKGFVKGEDSDYDNVREVIKWMKDE